MKFKGVLFDLDGTLANTLADIAGSMNRVLSANGFQVHAVNDYKLLVGRGLDNLAKQSLPVENRQPHIVSKCLAEMIADYTINCIVDTCLYDGIYDVLKELVARKIKLAVFSNKAEVLTRKIVAQLLPDIRFITVMGASTGFPKKPDPAGAILISKLMDIPPHELAYIGDSDVDMITATRAGMYPVGVLWGFRTKDELLANGAKLLPDQPHELLTIL